MLNLAYLCYYVIQLALSLEQADAGRRTQTQEFHGFFNGYQQVQLTNTGSQKWYYSSNQKPLTNSWSWTDNSLPSSNYFPNSPQENPADRLPNWSCGRSATTGRFSRIMGGQDAVPHSYPWMVSITKRSMNYMHVCGGTLITRRHVLTAAHCMEDFDGPTDLNVLTGIHSTNERNNPTPAMAITVHPQYEPDTFANDVAVVTLSRPLPENDPRIGTICLPPDDVQGRLYPPLKSSGIATGWGSTYFGGNPSNTLKQVILPILETNTWPCNIYVTYSQGQLCAGELSGGSDTCQADSGDVLHYCTHYSHRGSRILGGPLMIEKADSRWEIVGITSFGKSW